MAIYDKSCGFCFRACLDKTDRGKVWCEVRKDYLWADKMPSNCDRFYHSEYKYFDEARQLCKESKLYRGCYVVTAVAEILGLGEDCYELEVLRNFKAEAYNNPYLRDKLAKYDIFGPVLADKLLKQENRVEIALDLLGYIKKTVEYIEQAEFDEAFITYAEMLSNLSIEFETDHIMGETVAQNSVNTLNVSIDDENAPKTISFNPIPKNALN